MSNLLSNFLWITIAIQIVSSIVTNDSFRIFIKSGNDKGLYVLFFTSLKVLNRFLTYLTIVYRNIIVTKRLFLPGYLNKKVWSGCHNFPFICVDLSSTSSSEASFSILSAGLSSGNKKEKQLTVWVEFMVLTFQIRCFSCFPATYNYPHWYFLQIYCNCQWLVVWKWLCETAVLIKCLW